MGKQWGFGVYFIFVTIVLVAVTNTCLGAQNRNSTVACFEHERLALLKFKHGVTNDYGMLSSWVGNDCCRWERVTCDGVTKNVKSLNLTGDFPSGKYLESNEVGTSLRELRHLKYLDLSQNYFHESSIPEFIGSLKQLTYLNLASAYFCGIIPHNIGNLSNLKTLDLHSDGTNQGLIAHDMTWISGLSSLEHLDLSYANLSGARNLDMVLYMIPLLKELSLSSCGLSNVDLGPLRNLSTSLSNIKHLDLSYNFFKGQLSNFIQNMSSLQFLALSNNYLYGSIPNSLEKLRLLKVLDLSSNELTGPIPTFPEKLTKLYLYNNFLNGSIPESFGRLVSLTTLYLNNNLLSGTIPVSVGQLSKLYSIGVSINSLEGVVFESYFANLSMLEHLDAAHNSKLTFNISPQWLPPFQLLTLDLSSCKIENGFPQWLQNQRKLQSLKLSNATISGSLPTWFRKMPIISYIDLSHNNLSGPLTNLPSRSLKPTDEFYYTPQFLYLQNNIFSESIPRSLCKWDLLLCLDLSKNRLTGKIPKCFKDMGSLGFLKLNSNELRGVIPSFIENIPLLESLNLNDNKFSGELPVQLWNVTNLWFLDLGDNEFCGKIPQWIGEKITSLRVFRLHNNTFTGRIPRSLCTNSELQILDVAHYNFTGTIPNCLGELQGMTKYPSLFSSSHGTEEGLTQVMKGISLEYTNTWSIVTNMDLSSNKLIGEIPVHLTALQALMGLNLSNNHLSGGIPGHIGNMTALNSLDLSGNELGGPIPPSIAALTFLSHLNLSCNNLSGQIPTGKQLQTLIDPSIYAGNKGLCGAPLQTKCSNHDDLTPAPMNKYEAADEPNKVWFYVDIMCGYATGFWGVVVVLMSKKQWRNKLFMFAEESMDKIHVALMVRVNKMKRSYIELRACK